MRVLILGDGMLAGALRDTDWPVGVAVVGAGHEMFDIRGKAQVDALLDFVEPDVAINTVAFHRLAECEKDPSRAAAVNTTGAKIVASAVPTVYVSTDYVFSDGGPHDECFPGELPRSVYGRTKLAGEIATLEHGGIVVRVSGLFDADHPSHKGQCFPEMVAAGFDPLRLPKDQVFSPTYAPDAAKRIAALALDFIATTTMAPVDETTPDEPVAGIYHAANAGSVSWATLAEEIVTTLRRPRKVEGFVAHDPLRPGNSALKSTRLPALRHWRFALDDWIAARQARIEREAVSPLRGAA